MTIYMILGLVILSALVVVGFVVFSLFRKEKTVVKQERPAVVPSSFGNFFKKAPPAASEVKVGTPLVNPLPQEVIPSKEAQEIVRISQEFAEKENSSKKKVMDLEDELNAASQKTLGQSQEALAAVAQLKKENEELRNQQEVFVASAVEQIKNDNEQFKGEQEKRVLAANESVAKAQEAVEAMRQEQSALQEKLSEKLLFFPPSVLKRITARSFSRLP